MDFVFNLDTLKAIMKNKRYRSMVIFLMYIIFMTFVVIALKINNQNNELSTPLEDYKLYDNYEYSYQITSKENDIVTSKTITGKRYKDNEIINYLDNEYKYSNNVFISSPITEIDITKLRNDYIYSYIKNSSLKETNVYQVPLSFIVKSMTGSTISSDLLVEIAVTLEEEKVNKVELNLINYVNYNTLKYQEFKIVINYTNINEVLAF